MINKKIEADLLIMFEQSVGWEFRVKGTTVVDICTGVDKIQKLVQGKRYGDFGVHLCELTGNKFNPGTFETWLQSPDGQGCLAWPVTHQKYLVNRLWYAFFAGRTSTGELQPPETIEWYEAKVKELKAKQYPQTDPNHK